MDNYDAYKNLTGATVFGSDGERLGKVIQCSDRELLVEKGIFFPKDYVIAYADIVKVDGGDIFLSSPGSFYLQRGEGRLGERREGVIGRAEDRLAGEGRLGTEQDIRVPVVEEKLEATKVVREAGAVQIKKDVITEQKSITVPVTKEEVRVERVPIVEAREAAPGEATFRKETISVPVHEEEVEIRKRPVVKEEVRVRKSAQTVEQRADATVRREEVHVEGEDELNRREIRSDEERVNFGRTDIDEDKDLI